MFKKISFFFCFSFSIAVFAQIGGEATYQFLNLVSSPRQAALGGKVFTNVDYDVIQGIFNPATLNVNMDKQLAVNYTSYLAGISYGTVSYAKAFGEKKRMFHGGVSYINYGTFDGYDENGNSTGGFTGAETAFSIGHGLNIKNSDFYVGGNLKFISSKLEQYTSFGTAIDFGLLYLNQEKKINATVVIRNFGTQITTYADINESLPFEIAVGISQRLEHVPIRWHLTLENLDKWPIASPNPARVTSDLEGNQTEEKINFLGQIVRHAIIAAELFPEGGFNIRIGYNFRRSEELRINEQRNFSGFSAGFSLKMKKMRFSYSFARYTSGSNSNLFGLQIDLNNSSNQTEL